MRVIGVLGGMGPDATIALMQRIVARVDAKDDADHVPLIVDMNTQVPSRIRAIIDGAGEDPGPVLALMARKLAQAGAAALVMPCNTAHHYAGAIVAATDLPFLNMIELSADAARKVGGRVGVLASPAVKITGLFDAALGDVAYPADQDAMLAAIRRVKTVGADDVARDLLRAGSTDLLAQGANVQLIACSEFSLMADAVAEGVHMIDTLDVLADATVAFAVR